MKYAILLLTTLSFIKTSFGDVVVANNLVTDTVGFYSDAYDSNGAYVYAQSGAQAFSLEQDYNLTTVSWWGSSNNFFNQGLNNITGFQVVLWNSDFTSQYLNTTIDMADITLVATGNTTFYNEAEYKFTTNFTHSVVAGNYFLNIGAILNDAAGDQFVWSQGQDVNSFWFTDPVPPLAWGNWSQLPAFIGSTAGGSFEITAPAPGAIALLLGAGLIGSRRRKEF
jgi:hypothetical protein